MRLNIFWVMLSLVVMFSAPASAETAQLQGVIFDESRKPVAGAELYVYDSLKIRRPADFISPKTGADGRFSMHLPLGKYWAVARVRHGEKYGPLLSGDLHSGEPIELDMAQSRQVVDFVVSDIRDLAQAKEKKRGEMQTLSGRVLDQSGKPVAAATVSAWREPATDRFPDVVSAWTEKDGSYLLFISPGRYFVTAATSFPPPVAERRLFPVTVEEGVKKVALDIKIFQSDLDAANEKIRQAGEDVPLDDE